jgi:xanthine/CO dehydrogenase XdhC/CoxF family maturation factor
MAATLGWAVDVGDDRPALLSSDRFPLARRLFRTEPSGVAVVAEVDARTFAVVMSHHLRRDADYLRSLVRREPAYVGVLGPAARLGTILRMIETDAPIPADARARIHGPAGLDVGADGPEEIALAIMAEVLAVHRRATGTFLRDRDAPIHGRPSAVRL